MQQVATFEAPELGLTLAAPLGAPVPKRTAGAGGVERIARPKRKPLTDYAEIPLIEQTFEVRFVGFPDRIVDGEVAILERMAGVGRESGSLPMVKLSGPVRYPSLTWLIDSLEIDDEATTDAQGRYLKAVFTIGLVEYVDPAQIDAIPGKRSRGRKKAKVKRYRTIKGDTLRRVAKLHLGSAARWPEIRNANPKLKQRNPAKAIRPGTLLKIP